MVRSQVPVTSGDVPGSGTPATTNSRDNDQQNRRSSAARATTDEHQRSRRGCLRAPIEGEALHAEDGDSGHRVESARGTVARGERRRWPRVGDVQAAAVASRLPRASRRCTPVAPVVGSSPLPAPGSDRPGRACESGDPVLRYAGRSSSSSARCCVAGRSGSPQVTHQWLPKRFRTVYLAAALLIHDSRHGRAARPTALTVARASPAGQRYRRRRAGRWRVPVPR